MRGDERRRRRAAGLRDLVARDVGRRQRLAEDARVEQQHVDAVLAHAVAQERVLVALRVERAEQDDGGHQASVWASGSTPRKRRCASGSLDELLGRRLGEDAAGDHHELPARDARWRREVLLDQDDREPGLLERAEDADQVLDDRRREALGRLVHDQEQRVRQQRAPDGEHLLLAARELRAAVPLALGEAREEVVDGVDRPVASVARDVARGRIMRRCSSTLSDGKSRRPCGT